MAESPLPELNQSQSDELTKQPHQLYSEFPQNAWLAMMVEPRVTLTKVLGSETPMRGFWVLLSLIILSNVLGGISGGEAATSGYDVALALVLGVPFGVLISFGLFYVIAWVLRVVGRWFGGDGDLGQMVIGMVWGQIPAICSLALSLLLLPMFGVELFTDPDAIINNGFAMMAAAMGIGFLQMVFGLWAIVIGVVALSVTLNLDIGRAIAAYVITMVVIMLPLLLLGLLIGFWGA